jgi:hypothetical protein
VSLPLKNDGVGIWWVKDKCVHHFSPGAFKEIISVQKDK